MRRPSLFVLTVLTLSIGSSAMPLQTYAASPDLFARAHISKPYATHPSVKQAQARGLTSKVWDTLDDPQNAMALRAAVVDAMVRGGHGDTALKRYTLKLVHSKKRTLNDLSTHQLFALGWMRARTRPSAFGATEGKHEVQRADPVLMLNAAANRMRGELSINMVHALVKAQRALNTPKQAICAPHDCVDNVLKHHQTHWSMHPEAMCGIVSAVSLPGQPSPRLGTRLCAMVQRAHPRAPMHQATAQASGPSKHKRFSAQPTPTPGQIVLPGMGTISAANLGKLTASGQLPPEYVKLMLMMQRHAIQSLQSVRVSGRKGTPAPLTPKKLNAAFKSITIQSGDTTRAPQVGRVIELHPPKEDTSTPSP